MEFTWPRVAVILSLVAVAVSMYFLGSEMLAGTFAGLAGGIAIPQPAKAAP